MQFGDRQTDKQTNRQTDEQRPLHEAALGVASSGLIKTEMFLDDPLHVEDSLIKGSYVNLKSVNYIFLIIVLIIFNGL